MELLRLAALDTEDLTVISAHLQDAILRPQDLTYLAGEQRFLMAVRRFDWTPNVPPRRRRRRGRYARKARPCGWRSSASRSG
jgi:Protein of unknown function (DUF2948)